MVQRDHTCQYPYCIRPATKTCPTCGTWLCEHPKTNHLKNHSCKKVDVWQTSAAALNAIKPNQITVDDKGRVKIELDRPKKKIRRKEWHGIIDR